MNTCSRKPTPRVEFSGKQHSFRRRIRDTENACTHDACHAMPCHALQVKLSFSGTGEAAFGGVALFAHPDVACRCEAGYYLDVGSAPVSEK